MFTLAYKKIRNDHKLHCFNKTEAAVFSFRPCFLRASLSSVYFNIKVNIYVDHSVLMKVQFMGTSTVTTVLTQGKSNGSYMTQYRLEISMDCATFQPILDGSGNNKVFCVISKLTPFLIIISNAFRFVAVLCSRPFVTVTTKLLHTRLWTQYRLC